MDNRVPILVFDLMTPNNIRNAILGHRIGTLVAAD
jgi:uridylate kinase